MAFSHVVLQMYCRLFIKTRIGVLVVLAFSPELPFLLWSASVVIGERGWKCSAS